MEFSDTQAIDFHSVDLRLFRFSNRQGGRTGRLEVRPMSDYGWDAIREGEAPGQLVLDPETRLESAVVSLGVFSFLLGFVGLLNAYARHLGWLDASLWLTVAALGAGLVFLRNRLDDHYVLDFDRREVRFHRYFFSHRVQRLSCHFDQVEALVLEPRPRANSRGLHWDYGLTVFALNRRRIRVLPACEPDYETVARAGRMVSERMTVPFFEGEAEKQLRVEARPEGRRFSYHPYSTLPGVIAAFVVLGFLVFVVVGIWWSGSR